MKLKWAEANNLPLTKLHKCELLHRKQLYVADWPHVYNNGHNMPCIHIVLYVSIWYESELQPQNIKLNHKFNVWWNMKDF